MFPRQGWHFTLTLAGLPEVDLAVVDFTLHEALSTPFELSVALASRFDSLSPEELLDRRATLTVWQDEQPLRRVHGIVAEFARGDRGHRRTRYELVIRPALWRLSLRHNSRIFQHVSPITIITRLCEEVGITDVAFGVTREPLQREYCVQYRESNLAFIERLAAEEGLFYFHEFENVDGGIHRLVFADATQILGNLGAFTYHSRSGGVAPQRHIRRLRQVARVRSNASTLKDYTFKNPAYGLKHNHQVGDQGHYEHYDAPGRYKSDGSGAPFARVRLEHLRSDAATVEAESDLPMLAPGYRFTLTEHDTASLNRPWQVIAVTHHGEQPQALEEDAADTEGMTRYHNDLTVMADDQAWRPQPQPRPRVDGPQMASVVGPPGEEIYCDEHGRVKVQFPWDREAAGDETSSAWLRVSQAWAGAGYGAMAIPRIGHEVIVSFLEGDPDQPIITGRTYHATNTPSDELPANKTRTGIRSQTHKGDGFNELRFEDKNGEEQVWLHAQKNFDLMTLNDRTEDIKRDNTLHVYRDRTTDVDRDETHLVHRHEVHTVDGNEAHTVHQNRRKTVDGNETNTIGKNMSTQVGRNASTRIGKNRTETVNMAYMQNVGMGRMENVGMAYSLNVGAAMNTFVGLSHSAQVGFNHSLNAGRDITLEAGNQLTLQVGNSRLVLTEDAIYLDAGEIHVKAGATVHVDGSNEGESVLVSTGSSQPAPGSEEQTEEGATGESGSQGSGNIGPGDLASDSCY
ncbi:type VI secretion system tip protein TssI/VgrG [Halomonas sabkhae]|uniref:type VI secretion system Vgr family protein n=1 Tax=Halomonas sabkhae TaxID=626223 RepID=UPI0025B45F76|nr:type VI secretion system tip protein VgrG [Halomonas sabkhae]MDN3526197.1 type VI secretion system tip protein TssI/VgrG [Halomonas sabkhae]